jgi:hypothetical protein
MTSSVFHVLPAPRGGWTVRRRGATRASGRFVTKSAAVRAASALAQRQAPAQVVIHNAAGVIVGDRTFAAAKARHHRRIQERTRRARATRERALRRAQRLHAVRRKAAERAARTRRRKQLDRSQAARAAANSRR